LNTQAIYRQYTGNTQAIYRQYTGNIHAIFPICKLWCGLYQRICSSPR